MSNWLCLFFFTFFLFDSVKTQTTGSGSVPYTFQVGDALTFDNKSDICDVTVQDASGAFVDRFMTDESGQATPLAPSFGSYLWTSLCQSGAQGQIGSFLESFGQKILHPTTICGDQSCFPPETSATCIDCQGTPSGTSGTNTVFYSLTIVNVATGSPVTGTSCEYTVHTTQGVVVDTQETFDGTISSSLPVSDTYITTAVCVNGIQGQAVQGISEGMQASLPASACGDQACFPPETFTSCSADCSTSSGTTGTTGTSSIFVSVTTLSVQTQEPLSTNCNVTLLNLQTAQSFGISTTQGSGSGLVPQSGSYSFFTICDDGHYGQEDFTLLNAEESITLRLTVCGDTICFYDENPDNCLLDCGFSYTLEIHNITTRSQVEIECNVTIIDANGGLVDFFPITGSTTRAVPTIDNYTVAATCADGSLGVTDHALGSSRNSIIQYVSVCGDGECLPPEDSLSCVSDCGTHFPLEIRDSFTFLLVPGTCQVIYESNGNVQEMTIFNGNGTILLGPGSYNFSTSCDQYSGFQPVFVDNSTTLITLFVTPNATCGDEICTPGVEDAINCLFDCGLRVPFEIRDDTTRDLVTGVCLVTYSVGPDNIVPVQTTNGSGIVFVPSEGLYNLTTECETFPPSESQQFLVEGEPFTLLVSHPVVCGDGLCSIEEETSCPQDCDCCFQRECGFSPQSFCQNSSNCGLCPTDSFCDPTGLCSTEWLPLLVRNTVDDCSGQSIPCLAGRNALFEVQQFLSQGMEVQVGQGVYCGGFVISTAGVKFTGLEGAKIVPCEPQWWEPGPPDCQQDGDQAPGTPCWLGNSLITVVNDSVTIEGFELDGRVPNELLNETSVFNLNQDGTQVGAARGITNVMLQSNRTKVVFPVITVLLRKNDFSYLEDGAIDFEKAKVSAQGNHIKKIGTVPMNQFGNKRQGNSEEARGERKKGRKGSGVSLEESAADIVGNIIDGCDYAGMDGQGYDPSNFPFKKRDARQSGSQYDYETTTWRGNEIRNSKFVGLLIEAMRNGRRQVEENMISGTDGRGLVIEDVTVPVGALTLAGNDIQGVRTAVWVWKTDGMTLFDEAYSRTLFGVQVVNCNPDEETQPAGRSQFGVENVRISNGDVGYSVEDEPKANPLCLEVESPLVLDIEGGAITNLRVGIEVVGSQVNLASVSTFTEDVDTKVVSQPNSQGQTAAEETLPPDCPASCNGHGDCAGINICDCEPGYHQSDCSEEICGDGDCTESESLENCAQDCDVTALSPECSTHRGFTEQTINWVLARTALSKNLEKLQELLNDLHKVEKEVPKSMENCCSPNTYVDSEYPVDLVSITGSTYDFYYQVVDFHQDSQNFLVGVEQ